MIICPRCHSVNEAQNVRCANCDGPLGAEGGASTDPYVGRVLDRQFKLTSRIGSGELGIVYRGSETRHRNEVAVKILHPDVASTIGEEIVKSAAIVAQIQHSKIATVYKGARDQHGLFYIATEFLEGQTLKSVLEHTGPIGSRRTADILFQLCSALAPVHRLGRPHANLKPENIFLTEDDGTDFVKIVDSGVPEVFGVRQSLSGQVIIGTPKYFSPEQALGQGVGLTSDQFSLGIVGYQLLTGALPFFGATPDQLLAAVASSMPISMSQRTPGVHVPPRMEAVINRLLSKQPEARYGDIRALAAELATIVKDADVERPRRKRSFGPMIETVVASVGHDDDDDDDMTRIEPLGDQFNNMFRGGPSPHDLPDMGAVTPAAAPRIQTPVFDNPIEAVAGDFALSDPTASGAVTGAEGLESMPPPVTVTSALDSEDLAAALSGATAQREPTRAPRMAPETPSTFDPFADLNDDLLGASPVTAPSRTTASPPPGQPGTSSSANGTGASGEGAPLFSVESDPGGQPSRGGVTQGRQKSSTGRRSNGRAAEILSAINEELSEPSVYAAPSSSAKGASSPLATVADFAAIAPDGSASPRHGSGRSSGASPRVSGRSVGAAGQGRQRTKLIYLTGFTLLVAGGLYWYTNFYGTAGPSRGSVARSRRPAAKPPLRRVDAQVRDELDADVEPGAAPRARPDASRAVVLPIRPVRIEIDSDPQGARVHEGPRFVGETPTTHLLKWARDYTYSFSADGYKAVTLKVDPRAITPSNKPFVLKPTLERIAAPPPKRVVPRPPRKSGPRGTESRRTPRKTPPRGPKAPPAKKFLNPFQD